MEETEQLRAARAMRRAMLGDEYVDSMTAAEPGSADAEFQDHCTRAVEMIGWVATNVWAREEQAATDQDPGRQS